jgi:uncharacterized protein with HEPN domain
MIDNIDAVDEMMQGVDFAVYRQGVKLKRAVERCVEIISEASRAIPQEMKNAYPTQPWPEIAAIGNLLRHRFEGVDDFIMWKIAVKSLPELRRVIISMIEM